MPLKRRIVEAALEKKGFRKVDGDHSFFIYYTESGLKSSVRTKTSFGSGYKDISDSLVSKMAQQCKLTTSEFKLLVDCPLTRQSYEQKLREQGFVDSL